MNNFWPLAEKNGVKKLSVDLETMQSFYLEILLKSLLDLIASDGWSFNEVRFVIGKEKEFEKVFDNIKKFGNSTQKNEDGEEKIG